MSDTIDRFKAEYIDYHGISARRAREQVNALRKFEDDAQKPLIECDADDLRAHLGSLLDAGLHANTVMTRAGMIRPYFGWAFDAGLIDGDRLMAIKRVPNPQGSSRRMTPNPYSAKELEQWWSDLDSTWPLATERTLKRWRKGTAKYRRVWRHGMHLQIDAIVRLALDCGLRRQEIYRTGIDEMHPDNAYIVVDGKREHSREQKLRKVPFTKSARAAVDRWLNFRHELKPEHDFPWLALRPGTIPSTAYGDSAGKPIPIQPMRFERFDDIVATCGPYRLHRFRHTCATNWLRAGMELPVVSRLLGHASLQQTLGYTKIIADDLEAAMQKHEDAFERLTNRQSSVEHEEGE